MKDSPCDDGDRAQQSSDFQLGRIPKARQLADEERDIQITDLRAYLGSKKSLGAAYTEVFGKYFPAITLVEVKSLSRGRYYRP